MHGSVLAVLSAIAWNCVGKSALPRNGRAWRTIVCSPCFFNTFEFGPKMFSKKPFNIAKSFSWIISRFKEVCDIIAAFNIQNIKQLHQTHLLLVFAINGRSLAIKSWHKKRYLRVSGYAKIPKLVLICITIMTFIDIYIFLYTYGPFHSYVTIFIAHCGGVNICTVSLWKALLHLYAN